MLMVYLLQTTVPVALIAWLAFAPARSVAGFSTQALATGAGLLAISMTGIWAFPPWWTIHGLAALYWVSLLGGMARRRHRPLWPNAVSGWLSLAGFAALGAYAANETRIARAATQLPSGRIVELASPLGPGVYLVANGGSAPSVNAHATFLDQSIAQHHAYWGTANGLDLIALDRWGFRADGIMPAAPERYVIFGRTVIAPCAGDVEVAVDGLPDLQVPQMDRAHLAGNHVILRCAVLRSTDSDPSGRTLSGAKRQAPAVTAPVNSAHLAIPLDRRSSYTLSRILRSEQVRIKTKGHQHDRDLSPTRHASGRRASSIGKRCSDRCW